MPVKKNEIADTMDIQEMERKTLEIRQLMVRTILSNQSGHPGGSLSCVEILASLYFEIMNIDPNNPKWPDRDRFILSKGHASLAYYSTLAVKGFFPVDLMKTFRCDGSMLVGHPDMIKIPGVDMSTGSLGQGLSVGIGMALSAKYDQKKYKTYVLIGDGESQEGQIWEAALSAVQFNLDNLVAIIDRNMFQLDGQTEQILRLEPLHKKWKAFGWNVKQINGHCVKEIILALKSIEQNRKPTILIAKTTKGKGLKLMENKCEWHGMKCKILGEDAKAIMQDVGLML